MDGSEWAKGEPGYGRSVMMMGGEMITGYRKGFLVKQLLSSVLVAVAECMQAQVKNSMAMMQVRHSP
jgi:hypothetical protein